MHVAWSCPLLCVSFACALVLPGDAPLFRRALRGGRRMPRACQEPRLASCITVGRFAWGCGFLPGDAYHADGCHLSPVGMERFTSVLQSYMEARVLFLGFVAGWSLCSGCFVCLLLRLRDVVISDSCLCAVETKATVRPRVSLSCRCYCPCLRPCFFLCQGKKEDRQGVLAGSLLPLPVHPAWGKGFGKDFFSWHLWRHLPQGARKAVVVCAGTLTSVYVAFPFFFFTLGFGR